MPAKHWVEASTAIRTGVVTSYAVWHNGKTGRPKVLHRFSVHRKGGAAEALRLANAMRDSLNGVIKRVPSDAEVAAYIAKLIQADITAGIE